MAASSKVLCLVAAATAVLCFPVAAQVLPETPSTADRTVVTPPRGSWLPGGRSYLGLNLGRSRYSLACESTALICDGREPAGQVYLGTMASNFWGVELGYLNIGRIARGSGESRAQGLNLSVVGRAQVAPAIGLYAKLGTTYGRTDTSVLGASGSSIGSGQGFGLSYGGGLSLDLSPRLSATLEWDSNDFRFAGTGRDPVRSTSLGLKFKY
jgi:OmpA-OmpF porin, OOP family